jgi:hypothetical protein
MRELAKPHQGLAHPRRVGARLGSEQQRFANRFDGEGDNDLVGDLSGLAVTVAANQRDVLTHELEDWPHLFKSPLRTANHDR